MNRLASELLVFFQPGLHKGHRALSHQQSFSLPLTGRQRAKISLLQAEKSCGEQQHQPGDEQNHHQGDSSRRSHLFSLQPGIGVDRPNR
jgi:hypothetical protein